MLIRLETVMSNQARRKLELHLQQCTLHDKHGLKQMSRNGDALSKCNNIRSHETRKNKYHPYIVLNKWIRCPLPVTLSIYNVYFVGFCKNVYRNPTIQKRFL